MSTRPIIVAVDGPAGSGKSSICRKVCAVLDWHYLNTGSLYRGVAVVAQELGFKLTSEADLVTAAKFYAKEANRQDDGRKLIFRDKDLTHHLTTSLTDKASSKIAGIGLIREILLPIQRDMAHACRKKGVLLDGRDIGTVVFPDAECKIFLTANLAERAKRRMLQIKSSQTVDAQGLDEVMLDLEQRDLQDGSRGIAPLKKAVDAIELDTTHLSESETVQAMLDIIRSHTKD